MTTAQSKTAAEPPESADTSTGRTGPWTGKTVANRYRIAELMDEQADWSLYHARHTNAGGMVAVKLLSDRTRELPEAATQFVAAHDRMAAIHHENIVEVYDRGKDPTGQTYAAMEYIEHKTLAERLQRLGPMVWVEARGLLFQICRAIQAAHTSGMMHGGLTSEDCLVVERGDDELQIRVGNFGLKRLREAKASTQAQAPAPLDIAGDFDWVEVGGDEPSSDFAELGEPSGPSGPVPTDDVYSLAILCLELLTGQSSLVTEQPSPGSETPSATRSALKQADPELAKHLAPVLDRALSDDPLDRQSTAAEMLDDLYAVDAALGRKQADEAEAWKAGPDAESPAAAEAPRPSR